MPLTSADLVALLDLEPAGVDRFVGRSPEMGWARVYGGQAVAQALVAAARTVEGRSPHSLHAYFLLGGDPAEPITVRGRAGSRRPQLHHPPGVAQPARRADFRARRLLPRRRGRARTPNADAALRRRRNRSSIPRRRSPLPRTSAKALAGAVRSHPADRVPPRRSRADTSARRRRDARGRAIGLDPHRRPASRRSHDSHAALAYLSDMTLLDTALVAHGHAIFDGRYPVASLDHALVAAPPLPRRRVAALRPGQPERPRRARADARAAVHPRRRVGGERGARRAGPTDRPKRDLLSKFWAPNL